MNPPVSSSQAPVYEVIPEDITTVQLNTTKSTAEDGFYDLLQAVDESRAKGLALYK